MISTTIKLYSGKRIYDTTSGFRAINKTVISKWALNYPYEYPEPITNFELLKNDYRVTEIPVMMREIFYSCMEKCLLYDKCNSNYNG